MDVKDRRAANGDYAAHVETSGYISFIDRVYFISRNDCIIVEHIFQGYPHIPIL